MKVCELKQEIVKVLEKQCFVIDDNGAFMLKDSERAMKRQAQILAKNERLKEFENFLIDNLGLIKSYMINGKDLDVEKIDPELIEVESGTKWERIYRWWNLSWWSLPYEHAYGRQMRFIVWDKYHNAPIGLIGLQSPILSWSVRDSYLEINKEDRDLWVNQSLSAQRLGALPPYNTILGGKLVASLMTADTIRKKFKEKYSNKKTLIKKRVLPARLLFITTTGAYGKSSVYNRLKFHNQKIVEFIGYTQGSGTFHIPNWLYKELIKYLDRRGYETKRSFGNGPSRKLRLIDQALQSLDFSTGAKHGIKRAVYLFPLAKNLPNIIKNNKRPIWNHRTEKELTDYWKARWSIPRSKKFNDYKKFNSENYIKQVIRDINNNTYGKRCK